MPVRCLRWGLLLCAAILFLLSQYVMALRQEPLVKHWATVIYDRPDGFDVALWHRETDTEIDIYTLPAASRAEIIWTQDGRGFFSRLPQPNVFPVDQAWYEIAWHGRHDPQHFTDADLTKLTTNNSFDGWGMVLQSVANDVDATQTLLHRIGDDFRIAQAAQLPKNSEFHDLVRCPRRYGTCLPYFVLGTDLDSGLSTLYWWNFMSPLLEVRAVRDVDVRAIDFLVTDVHLYTMSADEDTYLIRRFEPESDATGEIIFSVSTWNFIGGFWTDDAQRAWLAVFDARTNPGQLQFFNLDADPIVAVTTAQTNIGTLQASNSGEYFAVESAVNGVRQILIYDRAANLQQTLSLERACLFPRVRWSLDDTWLITDEFHDGDCWYVAINVESGAVIQLVELGNNPPALAGSALGNFVDMPESQVVSVTGVQNGQPVTLLIDVPSGQTIEKRDGEIVAWSRLPAQLTTANQRAPATYCLLICSIPLLLLLFFMPFNREPL